MNTVTLKINNTELTVERGTTVLEAARESDIYIPALCAHPDLPSPPETRALDHVYRGRQLIKGTSPGKGFEYPHLCVVEIEGVPGFPLASITPATEGMIVHTDSSQLQELLRLSKNLQQIHLLVKLSYNINRL